MHPSQMACYLMLRDRYAQLCADIREWQQMRVMLRNERRRPGLIRTLLWALSLSWWQQLHIQRQLAVSIPRARALRLIVRSLATGDGAGMADVIDRIVSDLRWERFRKGVIGWLIIAPSVTWPRREYLTELIIYLAASRQLATTARLQSLPARVIGLRYAPA